ncbi:MAG: class I SAM-dependent methyltransferase, partial [Acidimicrobiales bacterium]
LDRPPVVVDLGTGSGAIALSVAREASGARVWATDRSSAALAVARANLAGLGSLPASRVRLVEGHWFGALPPELVGRVDAIVSNPPYVASGDAVPPEVGEWEPAEALVAGPTGLEAVSQVIEEAPVWLCDSGVLVVEVAPDQAGAAAAMALEAGFAAVDVRRDLQDRLRMVVGRV